MAKGQMRSNKETKKPKKDAGDKKTAAANPLGSNAGPAKGASKK